MLIAAAVKMPLFFAFAMTGELRNLSPLSEGATILAEKTMKTRLFTHHPSQADTI